MTIETVTYVRCDNCGRGGVTRTHITATIVSIIYFNGDVVKTIPKKWSVYRGGYYCPKCSKQIEKLRKKFNKEMNKLIK